MKKSFFRTCSVVALALLLFNPSLAFEGAKNGLLLWSQVVLPTLLPFMICSNVIVALDAIHILTYPFSFLLHSVFRLSAAGSYVFVSGLLCGYPMGAKTCSEFMDSDRITKKEGRYLLAICNHPSPMFLLGYATAFTQSRISTLFLLLSVYLPVFALSYLARIYYGVRTASASRPQLEENSLSFDDSLMNSCAVMVKIGGYIMLFSILALYITNLPIQNAAGKAVLLGVIEITIGIRSIAETIPGVAGVLLIIMVTTFGGLSGIFQTKSVIKNAGLSIRHYITWKTIHCLLSGLLFILLCLLSGL